MVLEMGPYSYLSQPTTTQTKWSARVSAQSGGRDARARLGAEAGKLARQKISQGRQTPPAFRLLLGRTKEKNKGSPI